VVSKGGTARGYSGANQFGRNERREQRFGYEERTSERGGYSRISVPSPWRN
jgi:hypothetical protein